MGTNIKFRFLVILILSSNLVAQKETSSTRALGFGLEIPSMNLGMIGYFPIPESDLLSFGIISVSLSPTNSQDNYYNRSETYASITLGDLKQISKLDKTLLGVGIGYGIQNSMKVFGGVGLTLEDEYAEYYDSLEILSSDGYYWVNGDGGRKIEASFIGGAVFNIGHPPYEVYTFLTLPVVGLQGGISINF